MKVGIVGVGNVGSACALSLVQRGSCTEIVLVDLNAKRAEGVALDMQYGTPLAQATVDIRQGTYEDLANATLVMITAGINEKSGGATDRNDFDGRLRLLDTNAKVYRDIVPQIVRNAPDAVIMVVTDPPDPLADLTRQLAKHDRVFSTGTLIDSLRFRTHLAKHFGVQVSSVHAQVVGEHGLSAVQLWSTATVGGIPVKELIARRGESFEQIKEAIAKDIRFANINIIEGTGASQYGIGMVSARLAEAVLRDEQSLFPVAAYSEKYGTTLSLTSMLGKTGIIEMFEPYMTEEENEALERSAEKLREAKNRISKKKEKGRVSLQIYSSCRRGNNWAFW